MLIIADSKCSAYCQITAHSGSVTITYANIAVSERSYSDDECHGLSIITWLGAFNSKKKIINCGLKTVKKIDTIGYYHRPHQ